MALSAANEAKNPQSQGLDNANEHQTENRARFIEKHIDGPSALSAWSTSRRPRTSSAATVPAPTARKPRGAGGGLSRLTRALDTPGPEDPEFLSVHELAGPEVLEDPGFRTAVSTPWRDRVMTSALRRERRASGLRNAIGA